MNFTPIDESEYPIDSPITKEVAAKLAELFDALSEDEQREFLGLVDIEHD